MRFLSLFSGIEAASVAFAPLGWECVGFSEIEPFPCALLAHRYPHAPNLGDVSKITQAQIEALGPIDVVCGGFPCQDLSVAGKRRGLRNEDGSTTRSGLFFDAMRVVGWSRARWLLIENVLGMLSSNAGADFASVVGAMAGCSFDVPRTGWRNTGVAAGPIGLVEWATLDAQWFGVPQRRRRVFLVRDSGDWRRRPPVLFERHGLSGHPAPRRQAREGSAGAASSGAFGGGNTGGPIDVASCLTHHGVRLDFDSETFIAHSLRGEGFDASEDGTGRGTPLVPVAISFGAQMSVPQVDFDVNQTLQAKNPMAICFSAKDHGGDAMEDCSPTLRAGGHSGSHANAGVMPAVAYGADCFNGALTGDVAATMGTRGSSETASGPTVMTQVQEDDYASAYEADSASILSTLREEVGAQAVAEWGSRVLDSLQPPTVLRSWLHGGSLREQAEDFRSFVVNRPLPRKEGAAAATLRKVWDHGPDGCTPQGRGLAKQLAFQLGEALSELPSLNTFSEAAVRHLRERAQGARLLRQTLSALPAMGRRASGEGQPAHAGYQVRRLTPKECARLQGFPDDYLDVIYRGKPASDGPKYKALGNSWAVPCAAWIGRRIAAVDQINVEQRQAA